MKLKDGFILHDIGDECVLIDVQSRFNGMAKCNETTKFIIECLANETTEEQVVEQMLKEYPAPREVLAGDLSKILSKLREIGALDE